MLRQEWLSLKTIYSLDRKKPRLSCIWLESSRETISPQSCLLCKTILAGCLPLMRLIQRIIGQLEEARTEPYTEQKLDWDKQREKAMQHELWRLKWKPASIFLLHSCCTSNITESVVTPGEVPPHLLDVCLLLATRVEPSLLPGNWYFC